MKSKSKTFSEAMVIIVVLLVPVACALITLRGVITSSDIPMIAMSVIAIIATGVSIAMDRANSRRLDEKEIRVVQDIFDLQAMLRQQTLTPSDLGLRTE